MVTRNDSARISDPRKLVVLGDRSRRTTTSIIQTCAEHGGNQAVSVMYGNLLISLAKPEFEPRTDYTGAMYRSLRRGAALAAQRAARSRTNVYGSAAMRTYADHMDRLAAAGR